MHGAQHTDGAKLIKRRARRRWGALAVGLLLALVAARFIAVHFVGVEGWSSYRPAPQQQSQADRFYTSQFLRAGQDEARYRKLFEYFVAGALANAKGASVHYAGYPSLRGYSRSGLEGFARISPMMAAWISSGRPPLVATGSGSKRVDLVRFLREAVLSGTDPSSPHYWGDIEGINDQRIVETPDIARMLWLTRSEIWFKLSRREQQQIATWLKQASARKIGYDNNWLLFPAVVNAFLKGAGYQRGADYRSYWEFKNSSYKEAGWFTDGPKGKVDFYNAWGISYELLWLHLMDPALDRAFISKALLDSANLTSHLISPRGIPILGRSLCYRTAVQSPMIAASLLSPNSVAPGMSRRALNVTWDYFVRGGALKAGALTMGYFGDDPRIVDSYSGPGSCHWGLRSLTLAFMAKPDHPLWTQAEQPLPVERGDYRMTFKRLGWTVTGSRKDLEITVSTRARGAKLSALKPHADGSRMLEFLLQRPCRPGNGEAKYGLSRYSAVRPLNGLLANPSEESSLATDIRQPVDCIRKLLRSSEES
jgi:hypothetical protein